jgi:hypothetical protein
MRRLSVIVLAALSLVLVAVVPTAEAAVQVQRTWRAPLGPSAANGSVVLTSYTNGLGRVDLTLASLRAGTGYLPVIRAGTCAKPGKVLVNLVRVPTDGTGAATEARNLNHTAMNKIWAVTRPGYVNITVTSGSSTLCGNLRYTVATRIRFPGYRIDLPVVRGPSGYPYCNVAMYQPVLWQPTEPGVTFIYAHARVGMFLPLLNASKVANGTAMVGKLIYVYTSDSLMYTYKVTRVRRHVKSVQSAVGITYEKLWLQTSEGPNFTYPKLVIEASRIAVGPATYAAAHPTPHIVHCR